MLSRNTMSDIQYRNQLELFTSADLLPTVEIYNSTNTLTFTFSLRKVRLTYLRHWRIVRYSKGRLGCLDSRPKRRCVF